jgi:4-phytase / acid phosphatase
METKALSLLLGIIVALPLEAGRAPAQDAAPRGELVRLVMLSRHGVRSPLQSMNELNNWRRPPTKPDWPDFRVCPGYLTGPGTELVRLMGEYYRSEIIDKENLFSPGQCPEDQVFIWSDVDQRTRRTAEALVAGLECTGHAIKGDPSPSDPDPACGAKKADPDLLFHPTRSPACSLDSKKVEACGAGLPGLEQELRPQIDKAQNLLDCCSVDLCEEEGPGRQTCELHDLHSWIEPNSANPDPRSASVKGQLGHAQSFAEMLMLQYAQGFSGQDFAFGRSQSDPQGHMLELLEIHTGVFRVIQRECKEVAQRQGENLLYHIAYAILKGRDPSEPPGGEQKLIAYVGHDTNIANVAGLLNLHWKISKYPQDDMPPGGALIFEVRKESDNQLYVDVSFAAQPPGTMRQEMPGAKMVPVSIKCSGTTRIDGRCSMDEFIDLAEQAFDNEVAKACVTDVRPKLHGQ